MAVAGRVGGGGTGVARWSLHHHRRSRRFRPLCAFPTLAISRRHRLPPLVRFLTFPVGRGAPSPPPPLLYKLIRARVAKKKKKKESAGATMRQSARLLCCRRRPQLFPPRAPSPSDETPPCSCFLFLQDETVVVVVVVVGVRRGLEMLCRTDRARTGARPVLVEGKDSWNGSFA